MKDLLPTPLIVSDYNHDAFIAAKAACQTALNLLQKATENERGPMQFTSQIAYMQDILDLANLTIVQGENLPAKKPTLFLELAEGVRYRLRLQMSISAEDRRPDREQGAVRSAEARSRSPSVLWDTNDRGYLIALHNMAERNIFAAEWMHQAVKTATALLPHAIARVAHDLGQEYDVQLTPPTFLTSNSPTNPVVSLLNTGTNPHVEATLEALADLRLYRNDFQALAQNGALASLVAQAYEGDWSKRKWDAQVTKLGLQKEAEAGWSAFTVLSKRFPNGLNTQQGINFFLTPDAMHALRGQDPVGGLYAMGCRLEVFSATSKSFATATMASALIIGLARADLERQGFEPAHLSSSHCLAWNQVTQGQFTSPNSRPNIQLDSIHPQLTQEASELLAALSMMQPQSKPNNRPASR